MNTNKIFILLPDGVGLRNFAFTDFHEIGRKNGFEITYWNNTVFNLSELGYKEIKIKDPKLHPLTDFYKKAKKNITLDLFAERFQDEVYKTYKFPFSNKTIKTRLKTLLTKTVIRSFNSKNGLKRLQDKINHNERKTQYYKNCLTILKDKIPALVFCTSQRTSQAISPLLAAKDLGIKTACFIFSWDNIPKATLLVETDYYFVWSDFMKEELLKYHQEIKTDQVIVAGTPQFEPHFNKSLLDTRAHFFKKHNLDTNKKYICFSGDDITTSPYDDTYLRDVAIGVRELNTKGHNLGIIFRRCPVDFSERYNTVLKEFSDVITSIDPLWIQKGEGWNTAMPTKEDIVLQINIINVCECVINLGSSMVFDFVALRKPCLYIKYNPEGADTAKKDVFKIYNYVHFRSMPKKDPVIWLESKEAIATQIENVLHTPENTVAIAKKWFDLIVKHPQGLASERIWEKIKTIPKV